MRRVGVELNASVLRAVEGPPGHYPQPLALDGDDATVPLVLNLERSTVALGEAGRSVERIKPHLVCRDFLPHVGMPGPKSPRWQAGRHKLDADAALVVAWQRLHPVLKSYGPVVATLPGYLSSTQAEAIRLLAAKAKVTFAGSIAAPLAAALIAYAEQTWVSSAIVVDVDEFALTLSRIVAIDGQAILGETRTMAGLCEKAWTERLLNCLADVCVWQTRRDPRDTPQAEQGLFDQIEGLFDATLQGRVCQIGVQGHQWYQNLLVTPEQTLHFCAGLLKTAQNELDAFLEGLNESEAPPVFLLTHTAGRLPGLVALLQRVHDAGARQQPAAKARSARTVLEDFGENLLAASGQALCGTTILSADALARSAHAFDVELGEHEEDASALPLPLPVDVGPARLVFDGQNHYLAATSFALGSQASCQLVFDSHRHPDVAARHCEIAFQQRSFVLTNRSRDGTQVNESLVHHSTVLQPGDWIRLGGKGPMLRFLGEGPHRPKVTTA
jgi:hypothetical protein